MNQDEDFPRGGINRRKRSGQQEIDPELKATLFDETQDLPPLAEEEVRLTKRAKRNIKLGIVKRGVKKAPEANTKLRLLSIEPLTSESLTVGMLVLGCIQNIKRYEMNISLPNGLLGNVSVTNISDAYTERLRKYVDDHSSENGEHEDEKAFGLLDMFSVGSYVVCKVRNVFKPTTQKKAFIKISLSMNPKDVNEELSHSILYNQMVLPAAVSSVEDHGFVMDIGFPETAAFLKKQNARQYEVDVNKGQSLQVGQVIFCAIDMPDANFKRDKIRVIELTAAPKKVVRSKVNNKTVNPRALIPGTLISATVSAVKSKGLYLDASAYKAFVYRDHRDKPFTNRQTDNEYEIKQEVTGRVLYVHPVSKVLYASLLPELCSLFPRDIFGGLRALELVKSAKVVRVSKSKVEFDLKKGVRGMAPKIYVTHRKRLTVGSKHSCRVLRLHYMERCALVSLKLAYVRREYLFIENVKPGDKVQCEVISVQPNGVRVSIENLLGLIPNGHLDDGPIADVESRFPSGRKITCKVLNVYPNSNYLMLTHKQSLVTSKRPILASYDDAKLGLVVDGSIVAIIDTGLIVRFYADVKGFVHKSNTVNHSHSVILSKAFKSGQTVACKVLSCDVDTNRLKLSLDIGEEGEAGVALRAEVEFPVGKLLSCRVTNITEDGLDIEVFPSGLQAYIPKMHLSDHPFNCSSLLSTYKVGDDLDEVLCFANGLPPIASLKPTFIDWVKSGMAFTEFSQLKTGSHIPVTVHNYSEYGLFVNLLHNLRALVPAHVLDSSSLRDVYVNQQTLIGTVRNLGDTKKEVAVSVAPNDVKINDDCTSIIFLQNYVAEQARMRNFAAKSDQVGSVALSSLTVGLLADFVVGAVSPHGIIGRTNTGVRALVTNQHLPTGVVALNVGLTLKAIVLAVDFEEECAELSLCSVFVDAPTMYTQDSLTVGSSVDAVCALVKEDYCLVALQVKGGISYGYMPSKSHPNEVLNFENLPSVGATFKVTVNRFIKRTPIVLRNCLTSSSAIHGNDLAPIWSSSSIRDSYSIKSMKTVVKAPESVIELSGKAGGRRASKSTKHVSVKRARSPVLDANLELGVDLHNYKSLEELSSIINSYLDVPEEEKFVELDASDVDSSYSEDHEPTSKRRRRANRITTKVKPTAASTLRRFREIQSRIESDSDEESVKSAMQDELVKSATQDELIKPTTQDESANETIDSNNENLPRLNVKIGFLWDKDEIIAALSKNRRKDSSSSSSDDDDESPDKTSTKAKENRGLTSKLEEAELFRTENMLVDANRQPETADDYDRLVLSSPDASLVWLKYMAFHLQSAEFDKARSVAERALKTISFREEQEKLNVWAGLLNLENQFGTKDSLNNVFQRALQFNEPIKVYDLLTNIYGQSENLDAAEKLYDVMVKRFKSDLNVWINFCTFLMKHGRVERARKALERSLIVLPKLNHVMMITKFVCLEFKHGEQERGRTMMESVVTSYPRRLDVWCVYVDLVTKSGDIDGARLIYERLLKQKSLQARKMKSVFKKYLEFEKQHGTKTTVAYVTRKAKEYVEKLDDENFDVRD